MWLFIAIFLATLAVYAVSPVVTNGDSFLVAPTAASIVNDLDLDISEYIGPGTSGGVSWVGDGDDGELRPGVEMTAQPPANQPVYDYFPWTTALVGTLLYVLLLVPGDLLGISFFDPQRMVIEGDAGLFNLIGGSVLTALMVAVVAATVYEVLSTSGSQRRVRRRAVVATALVVALGTSAWSVLSRAMWSQSTSTLLVAAGFYFAVRLDHADAHPRRPWAIALGISTALAFTARPTNLIVVVAFALWLLVVHRRLLLSYLWAGAVVGAGWVMVNLATWGTVRPPYFSSDRAALESYVVEALAGNLVSPNRGLLVFTPVVVLSAIGAWLSLRSDRRSSLVSVALVSVLAQWLVVSGSGEAWWAGATYGPRFMADTIPALAFMSIPVTISLVQPEARRSLRWSAIALASVSVAMHLPGAWSKPAHCWNLDPPRVDDDPSRVWDWGDLQALEPARVVVNGGSPRDAILRKCDDILDQAPT